MEPFRALTGRRPRPGGRGFTLLELLLALGLISVLAAVTISTYFGRAEVTLENAAILLAQELRSVQNRAAFLGEPMTVVFTRDGYRVQGSEGRAIRNPRTDLPFERRYARDGVFRGVTVLEVSFGTGSVLEIDADGLPREGGHVLLGFGAERRKLLVRTRQREVEVVGTSSGWVDTGF